MATVTLSTGISVPLLGTVSIAATLVDPAATVVTMQWDISQHLDGNPSAMAVSCDVSLDAGVNWTFLCSAARDKGYALDQGSKNPSLASITHPLPGVGNSLRMIRATLTSSSQVATSMQLVIS
jgi:hypothetical protein